MPLRNLVKQAARVSGSPSILGIVVALSMQILSGSAHSQTSYPNRPVTLVVPVPPGGILDTVARMVVPSMAQTLGQPVVIDNRGCTEFCVNGLMAGNRRISRTGYDLKHKESSTQRSH